MKKTSQENLLFGQRIKSLRLSRSLSIDFVSSYLSVAPSTYREWENGRAVTGQPYVKMANVFRVGLHEIMGVNDPHSDIHAKLAEVEKLIQEIRLNL